MTDPATPPAPAASTTPAWTDLAATELDAATLHQVLRLRSAVFVVEQECAYQDVDGLDLAVGTRHLIGRLETGLGNTHEPIAAYARILAPDPDPAHDQAPTPRIGRVIVAEHARGHQLARRLMERALTVCEQQWPGSAVELGAQAHLSGFYASLGFEQVGAPYDEDGILHVWMRRPPKA